VVADGSLGDVHAIGDLVIREPVAQRTQRVARAESALRVTGAGPGRLEPASREATDDANIL
jgi:hypothetical protein